MLQTLTEQVADITEEADVLELCFDVLEATRAECGALTELEERAQAKVAARLVLLAERAVALEAEYEQARRNIN